MCPNCKYRAGPFENKNAAISFWALSNQARPIGDDQVFYSWIRFYHQQNEETHQHREAA